MKTTFKRFAVALGLLMIAATTVRGRLRYGVGVLWANPQLRFQSALPSASPRYRRVLGACDWFFEH